MKKKPIRIIKIKAEVYERVYGINDVKHVIDLFNSVHAPSMKLEIIDVEEGS